MAESLVVRGASLRQKGDNGRTEGPVLWSRHQQPFPHPSDCPRLRLPGSKLGTKHLPTQALGSLKISKESLFLAVIWKAKPCLVV